MSGKDLTPKKKPLENFFNLPATAPEKEPETQQITEIAPTYDDKDKEVEDLYAEIQDRALTAHERMLDDVEEIDGRYAARHYEVAANYLNIALAAADKRGKLKEHKDKLHQKNHKTSGTTITNNTLTINTTELIKQLSAGNSGIIDGEIVESSKSQDKKDE